MNQEEYFGTGCIKNLPIILNRLEAKKIFLVTGKKSYEISGAEKILNELLNGFAVTRFSDFTENPKAEDILKGIDEYRNSLCDVVIAVGGGSVIDMAKSINILTAQEANPKSIIEGKEEIISIGKPLIAIPTTSGAGSEATHFAVVYSGKNKYSIAHDYILPSSVIIDPELTFSLNSRITATSGIDALCQASESLWSVNATEEAKKYSGESIKLILDNLESAVNNPSDINRINMSKAANLAGKAINITKTTAPHAVSYSMTTYFGIPHGQAVSITLGEFLEYNYGVSERDLTSPGTVEKVKSSIDELVKLFGCKDIKETKMKLNTLMQETGLKTELSQLNIRTDEDLKIITDNVNLERLQNNPRIVTAENLGKILRNIL